MPYIAPDSIPTTDFICRRLRIPNDIEIIACVNGALNDLTNFWNWEEISGSVSREDIARAMDTMFREYLLGEACLIGSIQLYAVAALPSGLLACDGSSYLRVDYPALYSVLSSDFITDADNFTVPDLYQGSDMQYAIVSR